MDTPEIRMVVDLAFCSQEDAAAALERHGSVVAAVDALLTKPVVTGEKHIPPKPVLDIGQDEEQKERCARGRDLMDKLNVVFSGAHRKTLEQTPPAPEELAQPESVPALPSQSSELQSGSPSQTLPPYPQSGMPR